MTISADDVRVAYPLFQAECGGSIPTSALQLIVSIVSVETAIKLNMAWHSRLPVIRADNVVRTGRHACYAASHDGIYYASAIWSRPVARLLNGRNWLELRRMAIADDAPANTASRMLRIMRMDIKKTMPEIVKLISYQDTEVHSGTIYKAAGWYSTTTTRTGDDWTRKCRQRNESQTTAKKVRWEYDIK